MRKQSLIFCLVFLIVPALVYPQGNHTGSITGAVRTPAGDPISGVIVLLKGPALIIPEIESVSNRAGIYSFFALSPGTYELSFLVKGLEKVVRKGIVISDGDAVSMDINLTLKAPGEAVVVEAKAPTTTQPRFLELTTVDDKSFAYVSEVEMMDSGGLKIEQGIVFASIYFIIKSLPILSFSGL